MRLWIASVLLALAPAFPLIAATPYTQDQVKIKTILESPLVSQKFPAPHGVDALTKIPTQFGELSAFRLASGTCALTVNLRNVTEPGSDDPRFEIVDVGEWECAHSGR